MPTKRKPTAQEKYSNLLARTVTLEQAILTMTRNDANLQQICGGLLKYAQQIDAKLAALNAAQPEPLDLSAIEAPEAGPDSDPPAATEDGPEPVQ